MRECRQKLIHRIETLQRRFQTRVCILGRIEKENLSIPFYKVSAGINGKNILITAGIHGHEPAGVYAVLEFLEKHAQNYFGRFRFSVYPCLNPTGFVVGKKGPARNNRLNLNRCFNGRDNQEEVQLIKKALAGEQQNYRAVITLHEDNPNEPSHFPKNQTPSAFYLYEVCEKLPARCGHKVIRELRRNTRICKTKKIYGEPNSRGVISYPESDYERELQKGETLEAFLFKTFSPQVLTFETFGGEPLEKRIKTQIRAIRTALKNM